MIINYAFICLAPENLSHLCMKDLWLLCACYCGSHHHLSLRSQRIHVVVGFRENMSSLISEQHKNQLLREILAAASTATPRAYDTLETLCISFPGRISGSEGLEHALDYLFTHGSRCLSTTSSPCNCVEEPVTCVPCWVRGDWRQETCVVTITPGEGIWPVPFPLQREIRVLANGLSAGTNTDGVSGEIVVVNSFDELRVVGDAGGVTGKIVLYDYKHYTDYGSVAGFRRSGAIEAAKYGAVGVLIRTLAPDNSIGGAHTGAQAPYSPSTSDSASTPPNIPAACVAIEDVELVTRLMKRGHSLSATLTLPCKEFPDRRSRNLVFELKGTELPDEVVIIGGHTDSWDCRKLGCQGAHDDGQGVVLALEIIRVLHEGTTLYGCMLLCTL
jgi:carboxypeptidase Q